MRIFITTHSSRAGGGISVAKNLLESMVAVAPQNHYFVTVPPNLGYEILCNKYECMQYLAYETKGKLSRWYWETFELPKLVKMFRPNIVFHMANRGFINSIFPQVVYIQDSHFVYPESQYGNTSFKERLLFRYHISHLKKSLPSTNLVFCQTPVMEERFKKTFGQDINTAICPNQFSMFALNDGMADCPAHLKHHDQKFKLFVLTRYYVHKNLEVIIETCKKYRDQLRDVLFVLTISEDQHPNAQRLLKAIDDNNLHEHIITVGAVDQSELQGYYQNCHSLFLPTLLESFSGTYLEAMNYETPIMTSDMDFARYVCGDAALYFDPTNVDSIFNTVIKLKNSPELTSQLVMAGKDQKERFATSWTGIAQDVLSKLENIAH